MKAAIRYRSVVVVYEETNQRYPYYHEARAGWRPMR